MQLSPAPLRRPCTPWKRIENTQRMTCVANSRSAANQLTWITTGPSFRPETPSICDTHRRKVHAGTAEAPSANALRALGNSPARTRTLGKRSLAPVDLLSSLMPRFVVVPSCTIGLDLIEQRRKTLADLFLFSNSTPELSGQTGERHYTLKISTPLVKG